MNRILLDLRYAVRGTFDLYIHHGKRLLSSSATVLVITLLVGLMLSIAVFFVGAYAWGKQDVLFNVSEWFLVQTGSVSFALTGGFLLGGLLQAILILVAGVYGVALHRVPEFEDSASGELGNGVQWVIDRLTMQEWKFVLGCLTVLLVVHAALFVNPFEPESSGGLFGMFDDLTYEYSFRGLAFDLVLYGKNLLLPVFLAMLVVQHSIWGRIETGILREYKIAYLSSALLLFSLNAVSGALIMLLGEILVWIVVTPFVSMENPSVVEVIGAVVGIVVALVSLVMMVCFLPAVASALALPFYAEDERLASEEDVDARPDDADAV